MLTCVVVFAWTDRGKLRPIETGGNLSRLCLAFGAHVDLEVFLSGKRNGRKPALKCLIDEMNRVFGYTEKKDVNVILVGGHSSGSPGENWQIGQTLLRTLLGDGWTVDIKFFNFFPGQAERQWKIDPEGTNHQLYSSSQCFFTVALDIHSGRIVAHTDFASAQRGDAPMWPLARQFRMVFGRELVASPGV